MVEAQEKVWHVPPVTFDQRLHSNCHTYSSLPDRIPIYAHSSLGWEDEILQMYFQSTVPFESIWPGGGQGTSWLKFYLQPPALGPGTVPKFGQQFWLAKFGYLSLYSLALAPVGAWT